MIYYAKICKPKYVLIENVPGLVSLGRSKGEKEGPFVRWIREAFDDAGYHMSWEIHNARDYGVPQNRKRVLFFACRKDIEPFQILTEADKVFIKMYVQEAIGDMPPIQAGTTYNGEAYGYNARKGYVICRNCLRYNKEIRTVCHECGEKLLYPITGGVYKLPGMLLLDCQNEITN